MSNLRIVATLPAEEALVVSGRLDQRGIPTSLHRAGPDEAPITSVPFHVMVPREHERKARSLINRGKDAHTRGMLIAVVMLTIALGLSAMIMLARWFFSGSPFPR